ncbi:hypothetical protein B9Q03_12690 [Candidatus Marsarchaeota G2 archaeon OSP_D]|uniref:CRISPR system endoribonuclease Csx1 CARF domain-containing protein n=1 Tax=Candidatus Marsarchaeota G2 archaeon OSP_D TaxID=1978157 RepID=A0A2R6AF79_9ARCH|nr:MAG: hypothetical protein B9Q03_12690 [Candidatus Marsarchaeota G2 archaeon OSP_D]
MGQGKSLLITSIGNPQNYSFTTYSYRGEPKKGCVSSVVFDVVDKAIYVGLASLIDVRTHTQGEKDVWFHPANQRVRGEGEKNTRKIPG